MHKIMLIALCIMFNFQLMPSDSDTVNENLECLIIAAKCTVAGLLCASKVCLDPKGQFTRGKDEVHQSPSSSDNFRKTYTMPLVQRNPIVQRNGMKR